MAKRARGGSVAGPGKTARDYAPWMASEWRLSPSAIIPNAVLVNRVKHGVEHDAGDGGAARPFFRAGTYFWAELSSTRQIIGPNMRIFGAARDLPMMASEHRPPGMCAGTRNQTPTEAKMKVYLENGFGALGHLAADLSDFPTG